MFNPFLLIHKKKIRAVKKTFVSDVVVSHFKNIELLAKIRLTDCR